MSSRISEVLQSPLKLMPGRSGFGNRLLTIAAFYVVYALALISVKNAAIPLFFIVFVGVIPVVAAGIAFEMPGGFIGAGVSLFITLMFSLHAQHIDVSAIKVIEGGSGYIIVGLFIGFLSRVIKALQKANAEIKRLEGIIPICAGCKKIRDDDGLWDNLEAFIEQHTGAQLSHGLCPDCLEKYSPFPTHEDK